MHRWLLSCNYCLFLRGMTQRICINITLIRISDTLFPWYWESLSQLSFCSMGSYSTLCWCILVITSKAILLLSSVMFIRTFRLVLMRYLLSFKVEVISHIVYMESFTFIWYLLGTTYSQPYFVLWSTSRSMRMIWKIISKRLLTMLFVLNVIIRISEIMKEGRSLNLILHLQRYHLI